MTQCYVGIITRRGLVGLFLENDHVVHFLVRRLYRRRPYSGIGFWSVLPEEAAEVIQALLELGEHREALRMLQSSSLHFGSILPSDEAAECY